MKKLLWVAGALAALAMPVRADEPSDDQNIEVITLGSDGTVHQGNPHAMAAAIRLSKYWIGLEVVPVSPALAAQLKLAKGQGLVVEGVAKDGPAAKAGVKQFDVLLKAGDAKLGNMRDLIAAIDKAKETKLPLELVREGKTQTLTVTPAKRPKQTLGMMGPGGKELGEAERKAIEGLLKTRPDGTLGLQFIHPGVILPPHAMAGKLTLPANTSVTVVREGDKPAKITIKQGDKHWEVTEKELNKLPKDVRPLAERVLGRGAFSVQLSDLAPPSPPESAKHQIERMKRDLEQMRKSLEQLGAEQSGPEQE